MIYGDMGNYFSTQVKLDGLLSLFILTNYVTMIVPRLRFLAAGSQGVSFLNGILPCSGEGA